jgi:hypothetical protein
MIYGLAGVAPLVAGFAVGKRYGVLAGVGTGLAVFAVVVGALVGLGFGY